ncbi:MAG: hypothetical protein ACI9E5_000741 [Candidatus Omnitrophota bacterium]|jgi:hypothetical protein
MKIVRFLLLAVFMSGVFLSQGQTATLATEEDVIRLKNDLQRGLLQVSKTRLKNFTRNYGDAPTITEDSTRVIYDYEDLKIEFKKESYWKDWSIDGFKSKVYTDDVDGLREDLDSEELVGSNITYASVVREYGEPTESDEKVRDGEISKYYYGDIRMEFENVYTLMKWKGKNLAQEKEQGILGTK